MVALERARERYEATPRTPDDELSRMARGDRSCLADGLGASGAVLTLTMGVLSAMQVVPRGLVLVGISLMVAGFVMGWMAQHASTELRKRSLESGPVVACHVVRAPEELYAGARVAARAIVVFAVDSEARFDGRALLKIARRLERFGEGEVAAMARGEQPHGYHRLADTIASGVEAYIADVVVYPDRLPDRKLPTAQPAFAAIVDPPRAFVEHV